VSFDPVHDLQRAYRKMLGAVAFPGTIVDLSSEASRLAVSTTLNPCLLLVALVLLDAEVRFHLRSRAAPLDAALVARLTGSRPGGPGESEFVLVARGGGAPEAIALATAGTFLDPQRGATIVIEVGRLAAAGPLRLEGPGIDGSRAITVEADAGWIGERARRNAEYPLGVDLFLLDGGARLVGLPRTTRITGEG
jgi:alpha-D-ribose 1-methylphosphonate 5-triphosphate synthase subunit PhnH